MRVALIGNWSCPIDKAHFQSILARGRGIETEDNACTPPHALKIHLTPESQGQLMKK